MVQKNNGYSLALFKLTLESGQSERVNREIKELYDIFLENKEYLDLLISPAIPTHERVDLLMKLLGNKYDPDLTSLLVLMCKKADFDKFFVMSEDFNKLYRELNSISVAKVTSVVDLSSEEKEKLRLALEKKTKKKLTLNCTVDKSIIGGITVEIDGVIYDGSIKRRLNEIKKVIEE